MTETERAARAAWDAYQMARAELARRGSVTGLLRVDSAFAAWERAHAKKVSEDIRTWNKKARERDG